MIHPSRLPARRPPTVAEFIEQLKRFPSDCLLVAKGYGDALVAPMPVKKVIYIDRTGNYHFRKSDVEGKITHMTALVL